MTHAPQGWDRAALALRLFALDPKRFGGIWVRARHGPVRTVFRDYISQIVGPTVHLHPTMDDETLFGGTDFAATLAHGSLHKTQGVVRQGTVLQLTMAERATPGFAARLGGLLDAASHSIVLLDEGADGEELPPDNLCERVAFFVDLDGLSMRDIAQIDALTHTKLDRVQVPDDAVKTLTETAAGLGIWSLRPVFFALDAARGLAALQGAHCVTADHLATAASMTLAHRAAPLPDMAQNPEPQADDQPSDTQPSQPQDMSDVEHLIDATQAALPPGLLATLAQGRRKRSHAPSDGSGDKQAHNRRGRPKPSRQGRIVSGKRLDLVATLRAAAPWQKLRTKPDHAAVALRAEDIRIKRFENRSDRLLIFAVDASGSAAAARMAEAKGAVELLLAEAYARRDHVALVGFRKDGAEVLLPPTRSLVQTKKRLAALPGGGGTPLAAGLKAGLEQGLQARKRGLSPTLVLLTDGRANVALDGAGNRQQAAQDATQMAKAFAQAGLDSLVIDTSARKSTPLRALADDMHGIYLPLPFAGAQQISSAISHSLAG